MMHYELTNKIPNPLRCYIPVDVQFHRMMVRVYIEHFINIFYPKKGHNAKRASGENVVPIAETIETIADSAITKGKLPPKGAYSVLALPDEQPEFRIEDNRFENYMMKHGVNHFYCIGKRWDNNIPVFECALIMHKK